MIRKLRETCVKLQDRYTRQDGMWLSLWMRGEQGGEIALYASSRRRCDVYDTTSQVCLFTTTTTTTTTALTVARSLLFLHDSSGHPGNPVLAKLSQNINIQNIQKQNATRSSSPSESTIHTQKKNRRNC